MTYIVTPPCIDCKYTDCAAVCPVEAFHELPDRLLINPDTCIDCDACLPECPVEAIDVAFLLAFIPYFVLRGPVNRIATIWIGHHRDS